jgi:hypothetical protein
MDEVVAPCRIVPGSKRFWKLAGIACSQRLVGRAIPNASGLLNQ